MKRFSFRLERVLEMREHKEREAEMLLAEKAGVCALLELKIEENMGKAAAAIEDRFQASHTIDEFRYAELYIARLEREREKLYEALAAAELEREKAKAAYVERRKEKRAIEKLKERAFEEYKLAKDREEVREADDIAQGARARRATQEEVLEL